MGWGVGKATHWCPIRVVKGSLEHNLGVLKARSGLISCLGARFK